MGGMDAASVRGRARARVTAALSACPASVVWVERSLGPALALAAGAPVASVLPWVAALAGAPRGRWFDAEAEWSAGEVRGTPAG